MKQKFWAFEKRSYLASNQISYSAAKVTVRSSPKIPILLLLHTTYFIRFVYYLSRFTLDYSITSSFISLLCAHHFYLLPIPRYVLQEVCDEGIQPHVFVRWQGDTGERHCPRLLFGAMCNFLLELSEPILQTLREGLV